MSYFCSNNCASKDFLWEFSKNIQEHYDHYIPMILGGKSPWNILKVSNSEVKMFSGSLSVVYSKPKQLRDCRSTEYFVIGERSFCIVNIIIIIF